MPKERNKTVCNYGFTVDELKERKGLKQFLGYRNPVLPGFHADPSVYNEKLQP